MLRIQDALAVRKAGKGFSLIEVVVVVAVSSVIFLVLLRWLSTLGGVAGNVASGASAARNSAYSEYRLSADLASATVCDVVNGAALRTLDERTLELYVNGYHSDGTQGVLLVRWRASGGSLSRTSWDVDVASQCLPESGTSASAKILASGVYTGSDQPFFVALDQGVDLGECETQTLPIEGTVTDADPDGIPNSTPVGDACFTPTLAVRIPFLVAGQDTEDSANWDTGVAPAVLDRTFDMPTIGRSTG